MTIRFRYPASFLMPVIVLTFALCGMSGVSVAQEEPDCDEPLTQMDMTTCAGIDFDEADAELNAQYRETRAVLVENDSNAAKELLIAQRAWIAYRDEHCETVGSEARGGSMEPMLIASCKAELTRTRTEELAELVEDY